jgi:hypothetical protein
MAIPSVDRGAKKNLHGNRRNPRALFRHALAWETTASFGRPAHDPAGMGARAARLQADAIPGLLVAALKSSSNLLVR